MRKSYDVIVIGAGNGGLAAAATCAKAGLSNDQVHDTDQAIRIAVEAIKKLIASDKK